MKVVYVRCFDGQEDMSNMLSLQSLETKRRKPTYCTVSVVTVLVLRLWPEGDNA